MNLESQDKWDFTQPSVMQPAVPEEGATQSSGTVPQLTESDFGVPQVPCPLRISGFYSRGSGKPWKVLWKSTSVIDLGFGQAHLKHIQVDLAAREPKVRG